jgi:hypothetical protein
VGAPLFAKGEALARREPYVGCRPGRWPDRRVFWVLHVPNPPNVDTSCHGSSFANESPENRKRLPRPGPASGRFSWTVGRRYSLDIHFYNLTITHSTADCNWHVTPGTSAKGFTHLPRYLNALWHLLDLHTGFLSFSPRIADFAQDRNPSVTPHPSPTL